MKIPLGSAALGLALVAMPTAVAASPAVIGGAIDCIVLAGGTSNGPCTPTHNQAGLTPGYTDWATDLHPYVATASHTLVFSGNEWFGDSGTTSGAVTYFVSAPAHVNGINHFVLWNEETSGIGVFDLWYGTSPGDLSDLVLAGISPVDNPLADYMGEIWHFGSRPNTGWWTLVMDGCPQPNPGSYPSCAIGEVAWGGPKVPEPATWAMMIAGFGLVGFAARQRRLLASRSIA